MTDQNLDTTPASDHDHDHDHDLDPGASTDEPRGINRRRMFLAGAGLAGAAVVAKAGTAVAADDDPVLVGNPDNETDDGATVITNTNTTATDPGTGGQEAVKAELTGVDNGSHAVLGVTAGLGHSIAGDTPDGPNTVAATWGRHAGQGAGVGGVNVTDTSPLAGPARGVEGIVTSSTNGSHAVFGATSGAGHSVAGDTPADAEDGEGGPNTTAATWGRHQGAGAGIGGVSADGYGGEFVGGKAHVRLIQTIDDTKVGAPTDDGHLLGELYVDGAGDLWFNRADGQNFTKLNDQGGISLFTDPQRAYDSREEEPPENTKGRLAAREIREIDLTEFTDFDPAFATGAVLNVTVDDVDTDGFATVFNGDTADDDRPGASTINWFPGALSIANGVIVATSATGTIKVYAHEPCEFIVDVVGMVR